MKDLVGFYQNRDQAEGVRNALLNAGYDRSDISLYDRSGKDEQSLWQEIKSAFGYTDEEDQHLYAEAARRGAVAVDLKLDDEDAPPADRAIQIMQQARPIDLNAQAAQWRQQGWKSHTSAGSAQPTATTTTQQAASRAQATRTQPSAQLRQGEQAQQGKQAIPVVEEELRVGKRAIENGGVRVYSRVTEKPVQEQVKLREERVSVERHPADRPVSDADNAFRERAVEVRAVSEEPVVSKQARVTGEVVVNKDVRERTETIKDKVRRTDVDVEKLGTQGRSDQLADQFAQELAADQRYRGRDWAAIEPEASRTFQQRYPESRWDQFKDAIHRGYDRMRQKM